MFTPLPKAFVAVVFFVLSGSAYAQTFYEPVTYQYQYHGQTFYYAGHDPHMFAHICGDIDRTSYTSVANPIHAVQRQHVYSDRMPYQDLADSSMTSYRGMSSADAENEANASVPRYFSMREVMRGAVLHEDGSLSVVANGACHVERMNGPSEAVDPNVPRGTILIIPKKLLQPAAPAAGSSVAVVK
jgi:hypothetical protein